MSMADTVVLNADASLQVQQRLLARFTSSDLPQISEREEESRQVDSALYPALSRAEEAAALSGWVEPSQLLMPGLSPDVQPLVLSRLASQCAVEIRNNSVRWLLNKNRRDAVLKSLIEQQEITQRLIEPLPPTDPFGIMLRRTLSDGANVPLEQCNKDELRSLSAVIETLEGTGVPLPDAGDVRRRLGQATAFDEYETLLEQPFIGRKEQLKQIGDFLNDARDANRAGAAWQGLVLSGSGGSGKSTLLAHFIRGLMQENADKTTVVILDFDRPGMTPRDLPWLEAEASRQVGHQFPESEEDLRSQRRQAREQARYYGKGNTRGESEKSSDNRISRSTVVYAIQQALQNAGAISRPFLIILDTFEEVIQEDHVGTLISWLYEFADALYPVPIKVIFSGRIFDEPTGGSHNFLTSQQEVKKRVLVGDFTLVEAHRFLKQEGISEKNARRITTSKLVPRRPLELKLLARVVKRDSGKSLDAIEEELRTGGAAAKDLFVGIVYRRVLLRIGDPTTQLLAYPGLVLRFVTQELIQKVLVPALGMNPLTDAEAQNALNTMASYGWLAYRKNDEVWHRKDLRRSTLKAMLAQEPDKARKISEAAALYFAKKTTPPETAEGLYHRLLLVRTPEEADALKLEEVRRTAEFIGPDVVDLSPCAAALVSFAKAKGRAIAAAKVWLLPERYRFRAYKDIGLRYVRGGEFGSALALITQWQAEPSQLQQADDVSLFESWENDTFFATASWDKLPPRQATPKMRPIAPLRMLASWLYPREVVAPGRVDIRFIEELLSQSINDERNLRAELTGPYVDKFLREIAVGLLLVHRRVGLTEAMKPPVAFLLNLLGDEKYGVRLTSPFTAHRLCLLAFVIGIPFPSIRTPYFDLRRGTLLVRLDRDWFTTVAANIDRWMAKQRNPPTGLSLTPLIDTVINTFMTQKPKNSTLRGLLRAVDGLGNGQAQMPFTGSPLGLETVWEVISLDLPVLFRGPDSEFRDPFRFALLDAYSGSADYVRLGAIFTDVINLPLRDLSPTQFAKALSANAEHALESYIELADRAWQLPELLRRTVADRPNSEKLVRVYEAHKRWDDAVSLALTAVPERKEFAMPTANLALKAKLADMMLLGGDSLEVIERPGGEPTTSSELFAGRNGYTPGFLNGWDIPLPTPTGSRAADICTLKRGGTGAELKYQNFSVVMSTSRRLPMLTACNIDGSASRSLPRINTWSYDGRLDEEDQWGDELYAGNSLDRGHQVRREDPVYGSMDEAKRANRDTFHFTNSCPQMAGMNQKTWLSLENYVLQNARADGMRVSVFTGPFFSDNDLPYRTSLGNIALIPLAYWKVVAIVTDQGRPSATAYKVSQDEELRELEFVYAGFKTYQISIQQVMDATGIDFSALAIYDGFSQHESVSGNPLVEPIEKLSQIRV